MLSKRKILKFAGIEMAPDGTGVSTTARVFARKYYQSWGWEDMASMRNADLNKILAQEFMGAQPKAQFKLKDGTKAEIRQANNFYYVAKIREDQGYNLIAIQTSFKEQRRKGWEPKK